MHPYWQMPFLKEVPMLHRKSRMYKNVCTNFVYLPKLYWSKWIIMPSWITNLFWIWIICKKHRIWRTFYFGRHKNSSCLEGFFPRIIWLFGNIKFKSGVTIVNNLVIISVDNVTFGTFPCPCFTNTTIQVNIARNFTSLKLE